MYGDISHHFSVGGRLLLEQDSNERSEKISKDTKNKQILFKQCNQCDYASVEEII